MVAVPPEAPVNIDKGTVIPATIEPLEKTAFLTCIVSVDNVNEPEARSVDVRCCDCEKTTMKLVLDIIEVMSAVPPVAPRKTLMGMFIPDTIVPDAFIFVTLN